MAPDDPFESAAAYYASHRPDYGEAVVSLVDRFDLSGTRVLDLGCGTGQLAVPLAAHAGSVVGVDPSERMLDHAREAARGAGRENVEFVTGTDTDIDGLGPFRLTTIGRAFHRMDGRATLDRIYRETEAGGGVAILTDEEWLTRGTETWEQVVYDTASEYVADLPARTGPVEYDDPWDELVASTDFADVTVETVEVEREWTVDGVVGYVFSLSFCSPDAVEDAAAFERDLRERLGARGGSLEHTVTLTVITGRK